jgi:glycosyltransferase involved in cell wall biosynthesis
MSTNSTPGPDESLNTSRKRVLYVVHGHPVVRPGGAEGYALELYEAMRDSSQEFEPVLLARVGPPHSASLSHQGAPTALVGDDPNQLLFETDATDYDWLYGALPNTAPLTKYYRDLLLTLKPDIVHFHHSLYWGYAAIRATRRALPHAAILYTLHEYLPICHRHGQMVRTNGDELCLEASPRRCNGCFPDIRPQEFYLREQFVKSHFEDVDLFIAPSRFLMDRYLDWGIETSRILHEDYGRHPFERVVETHRPGRRNRFGFFGQFSHYKGVTVLLRAMAMLSETESDIRAWVHGTNLDIQPEDFQAEFAELIEKAGDSVMMAGRYEDHELPRLMEQIDWVVVPSRWWENSPLVIQEAFAYGRPVISSDIGGMAEKVRDGVNGLHFRAGDPLSLVKTMRTAVADEGLWDKLRAGIPSVHSMSEHTRRLEAVYNGLLERRRGGSRPPVGEGMSPGMAS